MSKRAIETSFRTTPLKVVWEHMLLSTLHRTQKKYFDPIGRGRVKKLGQKGRVQESRMRLGTWNIGTLTGKSMEVVEVMVRRMINIMCLQETK